MGGNITENEFPMVEEMIWNCASYALTAVTVMLINSESPKSHATMQKMKLAIRPFVT